MLFIVIQSANRVHQHWQEEKKKKCPNNFDCDCVLEEFWECDYSMGLLVGNHEGCVHMSSTVSRIGKKTFHSTTQPEHEIKCLYFIISHISRFPGENICNVGRFWGMPKSCLEMLSWLAKRGKKVHLPAPKTHFFQAIEFTRDTPIFCTSKEELSFVRGAVLDERESQMMRVHCKAFALQSPIPEEEQQITPNCPHCFAILMRFSRQIVYTNIERRRRHKNVPTILTATVDGKLSAHESNLLFMH